MADLIIFRPARDTDLPAIVALLADDHLGATRETPHDLAPYQAAFAEIAANSHQLLIVAERDGEIIGTAQIIFMPGLSHRGMRRAEIEAVRIRGDQRGSGTGAALVGHLIALARERNCGLVQLTSDTSRPDAHRFYERLGFTASHTGFKLDLRTKHPA